MSVVALTAFLTVYKTDGSELKFQNGKHTAVAGHNYLSFLYQGAAMNRSGDNLEASLVLANNSLSMNYVKEFVDNKYLIEVETFLMTTDFNKDTSAANGGKISGELWLAAGMSYDSQSIELILSSAIDAVGANAPDKVLTRNIVGALPITGSIQNR